MGALQCKTNENGIADRQEVVELPMHIGEGGAIVPDREAPFLRSLIRDFYGFVDEYAVVGKK